MFAACAFATMAFAQYAAVVFQLQPGGESSTGDSRFRERYRGRPGA
jgi:hypothetical protein